MWTFFKKWIERFLETMRWQTRLTCPWNRKRHQFFVEGLREAMGHRWEKRWQNFWRRKCSHPRGLWNCFHGCCYRALNHDGCHTGARYRLRAWISHRLRTWKSHRLRTCGIWWQAQPDVASSMWPVYSPFYRQIHSLHTSYIFTLWHFRPRFIICGSVGAWLLVAGAGNVALQCDVAWQAQCQ